MTLWKRLLVPVFVAGALLTSNKPASAQSVTCALATPLGPTSVATATGHTEPIAAGPGSLPLAAAGGTIRVTCTNTGASFSAGAATLTISLGTPITNTTSHPSVSTGIRLTDGSGAFVTGGNVGISAVNNSAGTIVIGLGTPLPAPTAGISFPASSVSTFDVKGVLVSMVGKSSLSATLSITGTGYVGVPGPLLVIATTSSGLTNPSVPGGPAVLSSAGGVIKGNFTIKLQENYAAAFRDSSQFNGGGTFPQSASSDVLPLLLFNNIPVGFDISNCTVVLTDLNGAMSPGAPTLSFTNVTPASPILIVNFNEPLNLATIDVLSITCTEVNAGGAILPLHGPDITVQATLSPTGAALSNSGTPLTSLITGQVPRFQMSLLPATPLTVVSILAPSITSIVPPSGSPGDSLYVTINGSRLATTSDVTISGSGFMTEIIDVTDSAVIVYMHIEPSATPGPRTVTVTTSEGTTPPFSSFTILGTAKKRGPQITSQ